MPLKILSLIAAIALCLTLSLQNNLLAETHKNKDLHDIQMMMNYGLTMILDGSSLIMMAEMDIDTTVEKNPLVYGNAMIAEGKALIDRALGGPVMVEKHMQGMDTTKVMDLTHQLGESMLKEIYTQDTMQPVMKGSEIIKSLHVLHLEVSHTLIMAAQGSNMVITGQNSSRNDLNNYSIEQGRKMMANARTILLNLLTGKTLKDLGNKKLSPAEEKMLKSTKEQLFNSIDIVNLLIQMEYE